MKPEVRSFYLSMHDAAQYAAVSYKTIQRWIKAGILPVVRVGRVLRVKRMDLEKMLEAHICRIRPEG